MPIPISNKPIFDFVQRSASRSVGPSGPSPLAARASRAGRERNAIVQFAIAYVRKLVHSVVHSHRHKIGIRSVSYELLLPIYDIDDAI